MALSAYILTIVEKDPFLRLRLRAKEMLPWIRGSKERSSQHSHPGRASEGGGTSGHPGP